MDDSVAQFDIGEEISQKSSPNSDSYVFTKQVADYFGAYVAGGLSSGGLPLRSYDSDYDEGLLTNVRLDRYPQLHKNLYKNFITGLGQQTFVITQNKYTAQQDEHLLHTISASINALSKKELHPLHQSLASRGESKLLISALTTPDIVEEVLGETKQDFAQDFVIPYVLPLEGTDDLTDPKTKKHLLQLQHAAVSRLMDANREALRHIYMAYFASGSTETKESLQATIADVITVAAVKDSLEQYVEHLRISDAYQHTYALHRNAMVSDTASIYLYFGELTYDSKSFPLFYTKVDSKHTFPSITLSFENRIFINTQAIEYVLRHFAARTNQVIDIKALNMPHVIYSAENIGSLQHVIWQLSQALKLPGQITLDNVGFQEADNGLVSLNNTLHFYVASSSGSALTNDYQVMAHDPVISKKTERYFENLLTKPQTRFIEEITETWQEKTYFDKLLPTIPLTANDEQKQVLMALDKSACERITVDAPHGTGKAHLIAAATLQALSKKQTVLVASNNSILSSQLQAAVTNTLAETSQSKGVGPILNLQQNDQLDHLDEQSISEVAKITEHIESKTSELSAAKKRKKQALKESLQQFVQNAENINLHEVEQTVFNERRFAGKNWIDDEPVDSISSELQKLHRAIQYVRASEAGYLMPFVEVNQQTAIEDFITAFKEYEKASKNVHTRLPEFIVRYRKLLPEQKKHLQESLAYTQSNYRQFMKMLKEQSASSWLAINDNSSFQEIEHQETVLEKVLSITHGASKQLKHSDKETLLKELLSYDTAPSEIIEAFDTYVEQIATLKSKLFGFSGRTLVVENLNKQLMKSLPLFKLPEPEKQAENMLIMSNFVRYTTEELAAAGLPVHYWKHVISILLTDDTKLQEIEQIIASLNQVARFEFILDYKVYEADNLLANITLLEYATDLNRVYKEFPNLGKLFGITAISHLLARPQEFNAKITKLSHDLNEANQLDEAKQTIKGFVKHFPAASKRIGIAYAGGNLEVMEETFASSDSEYIKEYVAHKKKEQDVRAYFDEVMMDSFANTMTEYHQILGVELQHNLNKYFLSALQEQGSSIEPTKLLLKERKQLTINEALSLSKLFPCIAGEIHRISSVLPLQADMFDLVIIDAADALTIAEVLPIIIRAKKVLLVGDSTQAVGDTGATQSTINTLYTSQLSHALKEKLANEPADNKNSIITKQERTFVAHNSALEFFAAYASYEKSLQKQYGSYEELAAFGNKFYYQDTPISLTSRATPLADLIQFAKVSPTKDQLSRFTNSAEIDYIIQHLHELKDQGFNGTLGIVTPFAEQAAQLQKELDECVITDWFDRRSLKVMTFDTRRHHNRDYVLYSLVASSEFNELSQKLPSKIAFEAFDGDVRSKRLLAGFSGANHTMHIVHSLAVDAYGGATGETLTYLQTKQQGSTVAVKGATTDILLPTEANISQALEKTNFVKKYKDRISFIAKYPFVNYIKPLSPSYNKAQYKVFFLVMLDDKPLVIEYDDFKERFLQNEKANKDNGGVYLTAQDVYGYKLLENYGYRFLRLNKFNIGSDPARTLDTYLNDLIKSPSWAADNGFASE